MAKKHKPLVVRPEFLFSPRTSLLAQFIRYAVITKEFDRVANSRKRRVEQVWQSIVPSPEVKHHGRLA